MILQAEYPILSQLGFEPSPNDIYNQQILGPAQPATYQHWLSECIT